MQAHSTNHACNGATASTTVTRQLQKGLQQSRKLCRPNHVHKLPLTEAPQRSLTCAAKGFGAEKPRQKRQQGKGQQQGSPLVLEDPCPCASGKAYKNCCQKAHNGSQKAKNVETALRARFAAFIKNQRDYIEATTHNDYYDFHYSKPRAQCASQFEEDLDTACTRIEYKDFKVIKVEPGSNEREGFVAFAYKYASKSKAAEQDYWTVVNQRCRFLKVGDIWQFVDYQTYDYNMSQLVKDVQPEAQKTA